MIDETQFAVAIAILREIRAKSKPCELSASGLPDIDRLANACELVLVGMDVSEDKHAFYREGTPKQ